MKIFKTILVAGLIIIVSGAFSVAFNNTGNVNAVSVIMVPQGGTGIGAVLDGGVLYGFGTQYLRSTTTISISSTTGAVTVIGALTATEFVGSVSSSTLSDGFGSETLYQLWSDTLNKGILDEISVTDGGDISISANAGEIYDHAGIEIIDTDAFALASGTDDNVNYLKWSTGTALTLNTTAPTGEDIGIATINIQDGEIWDIHEETIMSKRETNIETGLAQIFPVVVTEGLIISELTGTDDLDVELSAGIYLHDAMEIHSIDATDSTDLGIRLWCNGDLTGTSSEIDSTSWCDTGSLSSTTAARYYAWLFFQVDDQIHALYPTTEYVTVNQAITGGATQALPTGLSNQPKTTAVIMKGDDTTFPTAGGDRWQDMRTTPVTSPGGDVTDYNNLSNLPDLTIYLEHDGSVALSADWNTGGFDITDIGLLAIGTSTPAFGLEIMGSTTDGFFGISASTQGDMLSLDASGNLVVAGSVTGSNITVASTTAWDLGYKLISKDHIEWAYTNPTTTAGSNYMPGPSLPYNATYTSFTAWTVPVEGGGVGLTIYSSNASGTATSVIATLDADEFKQSTSVTAQITADTDLYIQIDSASDTEAWVKIKGNYNYDQ